MDSVPPLGIAILVVALAVLYLPASSIYYAFFHPLAKVPGPHLYSFTQLPFFYYWIKGNWERRLKELHDQYGPVVRFTHKDVSFITANAMKKIYGHRTSVAQTFEKEALFYKPVRDQTDIINANTEDHRRFRRLLAHAFSDRALRGQEEIMQHYVDKFIMRLTELAHQDEAIDIVRWFNFTTFDIIGDLAFGQSFGCLDSGGYHPWVAMIFSSVKTGPLRAALQRLGLGNLVSILMPARLKRSLEQHYQLSKSTAMKRIETCDTEREDFMSYILRHNDEKGMTRPEIAENAKILIIAGSETTATLLSGVTFQLLTNRDKYESVVKEIRSSFTSEKEITIARVNQLCYMIAAFGEASRMYPPVPIGLPRVTPKGGEEIEGYQIPENTTVSVSHWSAYQSEMNFRDPKMFVPERWLDDPRYDGDAKEVLQPFSIGPRNCLGKK
ncbi:hypothetical protein N0V84_009715 [Fusarium piperis]|uniref:Cytochrome P450 monooxygenase n=1 Tax=Fusarium piperis TaxID=1435070 RepID=A0A9W8W5Q3_9HYPO|nr:hypothetical protein N0V84_009715 [Fusarium piperis]